MTTIQKTENLIRDHLSGTARKVTKTSMFRLVRSSGLANCFEKAWNSLRVGGFLVELKELDKDMYIPLYVWEI